CCSVRSMSEFDARRVQDMLAEANAQAAGLGDGTLFGEPVLAFAQLPTGDGGGFRHAWARPDGRIVAWAHERDLGPGPTVDQASVRELVDRQKTDAATVTGRDGTPLLEVRHVKHWKSRVTVTDAHGR